MEKKPEEGKIPLYDISSVVPVAGILYTLNTEQHRVYAKAINKKKRYNRYIGGAAGTGKSLLLQAIRDYLLNAYDDERAVAVTASTGIAAVNIDGVTTHAFLGITPNMTAKQIMEGLEHDEWRKRLFRKLEVFFVEEVERVTNTFLEVIDQMLKKARGTKDAPSELPFGGVQMLFFGDFLQLAAIDDRAALLPNAQPPATQAAILARTPEQAERLSNLAFNSPAWREAIEDRRFGRINILTINQRTTDPFYTRFLRSVRLGAYDLVDMSNFLLSTRTNWTPIQAAQRGYTVLRALKADVDTVNQEMIKFLETTYKLKIRPHTAVDTQEKITAGERRGVVSTTASPTKFKSKEALYAKCPYLHKLYLTLGAKVMLIKNLRIGDNYYPNGSMGIVTALPSATQKMMKIAFMPPEKLQEVREIDHANYAGAAVSILPDTWEGYMDGLKLMRLQFPVIPAYALVPERVQGVTLGKTYADMENTMSKPGLAYCMWSRCRKLEQLRLSMHEVDIYIDYAALAFEKRLTQSKEERDEIDNAKKENLESQKPVKKTQI